jgi:hypothetical protein
MRVPSTFTRPEVVRVAPPLLRQPGRVEDDRAAVEGRADRRRVGDVAGDGLDAVGQELAGACDVADERPHRPRRPAARRSGGRPCRSHR